MERMCKALNKKRKSLLSYKGLETSKKHRKVSLNKIRQRIRKLQLFEI